MASRRPVEWVRGLKIWAGVVEREAMLMSEGCGMFTWIALAVAGCAFTSKLQPWRAEEHKGACLSALTWVLAVLCVGAVEGSASSWQCQCHLCACLWDAGSALLLYEPANRKAATMSISLGLTVGWWTVQAGIQHPDRSPHPQSCWRGSALYTFSPVYSSNWYVYNYLYKSLWLTKGWPVGRFFHHHICELLPFFSIHICL